MNFKFTSTSILFLIPFFAFSHGSHGSGMMAGFTHPIFGLDHAIAIIGCAILGYLLEKKKWYLLPLSFLTSMILGGYLGIGNEATITVEKIIACSSIAIGIMILNKSKKLFIPAVILMAAFGFIHGYAHGAEMPETTTALQYIGGYSLGTLVLSFVGYLISKFSTPENTNGKMVYTLGGLFIGAGVVFLFG